jgi:hypothetical protein
MIAEWTLSYSFSIKKWEKLVDILHPKCVEDQTPRAVIMWLRGP